MSVRVLMLSAALVLTSTIASAQTSSRPSTNSTCPISFVNINPTGNDSFKGALFSSPGNAHSNDGRMFVLKIRNTSGKEIEGMKFRASYYDATHDLSQIPGDWEWTSPVKAGDEGTFRWQNHWRRESAVGWRVTLTKVLFTDGSTWESAGGQSCSGEYWRKHRHW